MSIDDKVFVGKKIKYFRKKNKLTQGELAEKVDLSEKHISKIEAGIHQPSLSAFFKIIDVLDINLDEFYISTSKEINPIKKELFECINNSTDTELEFMLAIFKCIKENSKFIKQ